MVVQTAEKRPIHASKMQKKRWGEKTLNT